MTARSRIYLDHAATTPVLPEAKAAVGQALDRWANPSSPHSEGRAARAALEEARRRIAEALVWRHDVILTSGATEAIRLASRGSKLDRLARGATEHDAVAAAMPDAHVLPVDSNGLIDMGALDAFLAEGPGLIALQQVNNETGVIQPLQSIYEKVRGAGSLLLADCAQGAGKLPLPDADFIAVSGHKLGGPPGVGALLVRDVATLKPSGGQEKGYRRGTEDLPAVAGMAAALEGRAFADAMARLAELRSKLEEDIADEGGIPIAADVPRSPAIGVYGMPGVTSAAQLVQFDLAGIAVSAGSACSSGSMKPSHVLEAMGIRADVAGSVVRVSFGPGTSIEDVERFLTEWRGIRDRAGARAA